MVKIRLARRGTKKRPFYDIVVTDHRNPRDSGFIERVGYFNPIATGKEIKLFIDKEKIAAWIAKGAQASERVAFLMQQFEAMAKETTEQEAVAA